MIKLLLIFFLINLPLLLNHFFKCILNITYTTGKRTDNQFLQIFGNLCYLPSFLILTVSSYDQVSNFQNKNKWCGKSYFSFDRQLHLPSCTYYHSVKWKAAFNGENWFYACDELGKTSSEGKGGCFFFFIPSWEQLKKIQAKHILLRPCGSIILWMWLSKIFLQ